MKIFKAMNNFFFGEDYVCLSDALWFYGTMSFMLVMGTVFMFLNLTQ